jgi:hypothetical protein
MVCNFSKQLFPAISPKSLNSLIITICKEETADEIRNVRPGSQMKIYCFAIENKQAIQVEETQRIHETDKGRDEPWIPLPMTVKRICFCCPHQPGKRYQTDANRKSRPAAPIPAEIIGDFI